MLELIVFPQFYPMPLPPSICSCWETIMVPVFCRRLGDTRFRFAITDIKAKLKSVCNPQGRVSCDINKPLNCNICKWIVNKWIHLVLFFFTHMIKSDTAENREQVFPRFPLYFGGSGSDQMELAGKNLQRKHCSSVWKGNVWRFGINVYVFARNCSNPWKKHRMRVMFLPKISLLVFYLAERHSG